LKEEILDLGIGDKMKIRVMYKGDMQWSAGTFDLELMLYKSDFQPNSKSLLLGDFGLLLRQVRNLSDIGSIIEENKTIYVLREPMELQGGQIMYESVEFNIDFILNSSTLFMVKPVLEVETEEPPSKDALQRLDKYLDDPKQGSYVGSTNKDGLTS
jgi:hypothetical protein